MTIAFANRVRFRTPTQGTGIIQVGAAQPGFQLPSAGGIANGSIVGYCIEEDGKFEVGQGIYSNGSVSRLTVETSSLNGSLISLQGGAIMFLTVTADQMKFLLNGGAGIAVLA